MLPNLTASAPPRYYTSSFTSFLSDSSHQVTTKTDPMHQDMKHHSTWSKTHPIHMPFEKLKIRQELNKKHPLSENRRNKKKKCFFFPWNLKKKLIFFLKPLCPLLTPTSRRFSWWWPRHRRSCTWSALACANGVDLQRSNIGHPPNGARHCYNESHYSEWI